MATAFSSSRISEKQPHQSEGKRNINILLLGETGVGKSTWINAFTMLVQRKTFEAALEDPVFAVPPTFTEVELNDGEYDETTTSVRRSDLNELHDTPGDSVTQMPAVYKIETSDCILCLIDTPGVGDTRGEEQDQTNLQYIFDTLSGFDQLHGILILLISDQSRFTDRFRYCLESLLENLHEDANKHLMFCLTKSQSTFFEPRKTLGLLNRFSKESNLRLNTKHENIYCVDNMSVECIAKLAKHRPVNTMETQAGRQCWEQSAHAYLRMNDRFRRLDSMEIFRVKSVYDTKRRLEIVAGVIMKVVESIANDVDETKKQKTEIEEKKKEIANDVSCGDKYDLRYLLYKAASTLRVVPMTYSVTICTSRNCEKVRKDAAGSQISYVCHRSSQWIFPMFLREVFGGGKCKNCGCEYTEHTSETSKIDVERRKILDSNVEAMVFSSDEALDVLTKHLETLNQHIKDLQDEKEQMISACAKMSVFIKASVLLKDREPSHQGHRVDGAKKNPGSGRGDEMVKQLNKRLSESALTAENNRIEELESLREIRKVYHSKLKSYRLKTFSIDEMSKEMACVYALKLKGADVKQATEEIEANRKTAINMSLVKEFPMLAKGEA